MTLEFEAGLIPLLTRRGGCGIKKISAKPTLSAADGVVAHEQRLGVNDHPVRSIKGGFAAFS